MTELSLPQAIDRLKSNEARINSFTNGNADGFYTASGGEKVETLPSLVSRLAAAIAQANAARADLAAATGAGLIGYGESTVSATLDSLTTGLAGVKKTADGALQTSGGTLTGSLILKGDPTKALEAATKRYVDSGLAGYSAFAVGDVLISTQAPNANFLPDGSYYLQASYPELFARMGLIDSNSYTVYGNWTTQSSGTTNALQGVDTDCAGVWVAVGSAGTILRSADNGLTWATVSSGVTSVLYDVATDRKGVWIAAGAVGASSSTVILRSIDNGLTWTQLSGVPTNQNITVVATDRAGVWVYGCNSGLGRSTDNGLTWAVVSGMSGTTNLNTTSIANQGNNWFAYVSNSVFARSTDKGATWTSATVKTANYSVTSAAVGFGPNGEFIIGYSSQDSTTSSSTNYYSWGFKYSTDFSNWTQVMTAANSFSTSDMAVDTRGQVLGIGTSGSRYSLNSGLSSGQLSIQANGCATDNFDVWIVVGGTGAIKRCAARYDTRSQFYVPKFSAEAGSPPKFRGYIKAK